MTSRGVGGCSDLGTQDTEWPETTMEQGVGSPPPDGVEVNFSEKKITISCILSG